MDHGLSPALGKTGKLGQDVGDAIGEEQSCADHGLSVPQRDTEPVFLALYIYCSPFEEAHGRVGRDLCAHGL